MRRPEVLTAACALFAGAAIFILWRGKLSDRVMAETTLAMFGGGAVLGASLAWSKRRDGKDTQSMVPQGVVYPTRRAPSLLVGLWLTLIGLPAIASGQALANGFRTLTSGIGVLGAGFALLIALGFRRNLFVYLSPEELQLGQPGYVLRVPWSEITRVAVGEFQLQPFVALSVAEPKRLACLIDPGPKGAAWATEQLARRTRRFQAWSGHDVVVMTPWFGLSASALARAIGAELGKAQRSV